MWFESVQKDKWEDALDRKVAELKIGSEPRTVSDAENALTALALMDREQISGTAIVDSEGRLYGSISTSDLKHAAQNTGMPSLTC
jgi:CBS domain-containing protein